NKSADQVGADVILGYLKSAKSALSADRKFLIVPRGHSRLSSNSPPECLRNFQLMSPSVSTPSRDMMIVPVPSEPGSWMPLLKMFSSSKHGAGVPSPQLSR